MKTIQLTDEQARLFEQFLSEQIIKKEQEMKELAAIRISLTAIPTAEIKEAVTQKWKPTPAVKEVKVMTSPKKKQRTHRSGLGNVLVEAIKASDKPLSSAEVSELIKGKYGITHGAGFARLLASVGSFLKELTYDRKDKKAEIARKQDENGVFVYYKKQSNNVPSPEHF